MKNVKEYGAKANGIANDTKAIQKADKEARAVFPAGTYVVGNLVLENPPVFEGFVRFRPDDKCEFVVKFSTDNQRPYEPVQGSFHVNLYRENMVYKNEITGVIIEGGGWYFPKITINGNKQTNELLTTNKTGLKITDQGAGHVPATHNHIDYLGITGCNSSVLFEVDKSSYAKNNQVNHAYLMANLSMKEGDSAIRYIYRGGPNYSSNKFNQAYIEKFDRGISFEYRDAGNSHETGISGDYFDVHFDTVEKEIFINNLAPNIFVFDRNVNNNNFDIKTINGGSAVDIKILFK